MSTPAAASTELSARAEQFGCRSARTLIRVATFHAGGQRLTVRRSAIAFSR
jgi:hypothetical protein